MTELDGKLEEAGIIAVLELDDPASALPIAESLLAGGIKAAEITFRNEASYGAAAASITEIRSKCPQLLIGAASVSSPAIAEKAAAAGAQFIISAGFNPYTVDFCIERKLPVYPGVCTPGEIEKALSLGLTTLKFFPAEASGGVNALKAYAGPYPNVKFIVSGGINGCNAPQYFACRNTAAVSGSWIASKDLIAQKNWAEITRLSREAVMLSLGFKFAHVGINYKNEEAAAESAGILDGFGFAGNENPVSWFCGSDFELMKNGGPGANGHIGILTWNIERALAYLAGQGIAPIMETAKWCGEPEKSPLMFIYIDREIGGFAVHLKKR